MVAALSTGTLVVFGLIGVALALFVTEWLPPDTTAVGVLVALAVLEPYTGVTATDALQGFASSATVTILAMYVLSSGVDRTGVVDYLGAALADVTAGDETRLLGATVGVTGLTAGIINNTPVVAVFIPMITRLSDRAGVSPSKLLMPLSFAAMLGGTLTLVGTATNLLASDLSRALLDHPLTMFELTPVGALVLFVGVLYLLTVGPWLVPARVPPKGDVTERYDLRSHLSIVVVREGSPLVGHTVAEAFAGELDAGVDADPADETVGQAPPTTDAEALEADPEPAPDVDLLQVQRDDESFVSGASSLSLAAGDRLTVRGSLREVNRFAETFGLRQRSREVVTADELVQGPYDTTLAEALVYPDSRVVGQTISDLKLPERFDTTVLAVRQGERFRREDVGGVELERGDTLLLQTTAASADYFEEAGYFLVTERVAEDVDGERERDVVPDEEAIEIRGERPELGVDAGVAVAVLLGAVALAGAGLVSIPIAALGGVVVLVAADVVTPAQAYEAVNWSVVFLLAGLLPLGIAMRQTGGAEVLASLLVGAGSVLPVVGLLAALYLLTAVVAAIITPVATVVLLIPVAVDTAQRLGFDGFPFLLIVTFAAANAFLTPIGYQTNLMVYGPGRYKFTDYARVGAPLQLLLAVVTTMGVVTLWPP